jgi:hypothetical protein
MSRIIINNESSAHDTFALQCVKQIISEGRTSGDSTRDLPSYCFVTVVHAANVVILARRNKDSDTFTVRDYVQ